MRTVATHPLLITGWMLTCSLAVLASGVEASTVYLGNPSPGGLRYHLYVSFDHAGTLTVTTGQALPQIGDPADRQDFNSDDLVDEVGLNAWRGGIDPTGWSQRGSAAGRSTLAGRVADLTGLHTNGTGKPKCASRWKPTRRRPRLAALSLRAQGLLR